jgi:hypothetical protein
LEQPPVSGYLSSTQGQKRPELRVSIFSRLFNRHPPRDQLVIDVANELKRRGRTGGYNHQEYTVTTGEVTIGLHNLFLEWRLLDRRDKAAAVRRYLDVAFENGKPLLSYDEQAEKFFPLVRSRDYISIHLLTNLIAGAPEGNSAETAWAPFVGDLVTAVAIDGENGIASMLRVNLKHLGVSFETAFARALDNFRKKAPALVFKEVGHGLPPGVFYSESATDYQSSMLLLPERFPELPAGSGDPIIAVPGRNSMWMTGSRNEAGLAALLTVGENALHSIHHRCSTALLRLDRGRFVPFVPDANEALRNRYLTVQQKQEAVNYGEQTDALTRLCAQRGEDVYVAPFNVAIKDEGPDARSWTWTTWASHADSLITRAEYIVFVDQIVDPTGRATGASAFIEVAWDEAVPLVSDLMEQLPDVHPPRYRVRHFPDPATLLELERRGTRLAGSAAR